MFNSILIICTGNICRSPIGERYLRKMLPDKVIDSAGLDALVDSPADSNASLVAEKNGLSLERHKGRQFTASIGRRYDLILVMEKNHIEQIGKISPELRGKTMLYSYWLNKKDIPDPYRKSYEAFESVYKLIEQAGACWVEKLRN